MWIIKFLLAMPVFAASFKGEIQKAQFDRILVRIPEAQISLKAGSDQNLTWEASEGADELIAVRNDRTLEIRTRDFETKKEFSKGSKINLEIRAKNFPVEVYLIEGQVNLDAWTGGASVSIMRGKLTSRNGGGPLKIHVQKGDVDVFKNNGPIQVDTYLASLNLHEQKGDVEATTFHAETTIAKMNGVLKLNQGQGTTKVQESVGTIHFDGVKGVLSTVKFEGRIDASTQEGLLTISQGADNDLNLKSRYGRIQVTTFPKNATWLNVVTQEGELIAPAYLRVARDGMTKIIRARTQGESQKGNVTIRSQEGTIIIK